MLRTSWVSISHLAKLTHFLFAAADHGKAPDIIDRNSKINGLRRTFDMLTHDVYFNRILYFGLRSHFFEPLHILFRPVYYWHGYDLRNRIGMHFKDFCLKSIE